jgi:uncharacterized C2H2 Zn-finger protein
MMSIRAIFFFPHALGFWDHGRVTSYYQEFHPDTLKEWRWVDRRAVYQSLICLLRLIPSHTFSSRKTWLAILQVPLSLGSRLCGMATLCCAVCGRAFSSSSNMKRHWEHVHGTKQDQCPVCNKLFGRHDDMLRHRRKAHEAVNGAARDASARGQVEYDDKGRVMASQWNCEGDEVKLPPHTVHPLTPG